MSFIGAAVTVCGQTCSSPLTLGKDSRQRLSQYGVRIGLYTSVVGGAIPIAYSIKIGGTEKCIVRLLLTSPGQVEQKIFLLEHVNCFTTMPICTKVTIGTYDFR